jgi:hypothetical protein
MGAPMCRGRTRDAAVGGAKIMVAPGRAVPAHVRVFAVSQTILPPHRSTGRGDQILVPATLCRSSTRTRRAPSRVLYSGRPTLAGNVSTKGGRHVSDSASD